LTYFGIREHLAVLLTRFVLRMRRNYYFWDSGPNFVIAIMFSSLSFLKECNNLAIIRRFQLFFFTVQVKNLLYFYLYKSLFTNYW